MFKPAQHILYVANDANSEKALQLLDLLHSITEHVQVVNVMDEGIDIPAWLKGVPSLYNGRLGTTSEGTNALEELIDEDDHAIELKKAPPALAGINSHESTVETRGEYTKSGTNAFHSKLGSASDAKNNFAPATSELVGTPVPGSIDCGDEKAYLKRREEAMKAALAKRDSIGDPFAETRRL